MRETSSSRCSPIACLASTSAHCSYLPPLASLHSPRDAHVLPPLFSVPRRLGLAWPLDLDPSGRKLSFSYRSPLLSALSTTCPGRKSQHIPYSRPCTSRPWCSYVPGGTGSSNIAETTSERRPMRIAVHGASDGKLECRAYYPPSATPNKQGLMFFSRTCLNKHFIKKEKEFDYNTHPT